MPMLERFIKQVPLFISLLMTFLLKCLFAYSYMYTYIIFCMAQFYCLLIWLNCINMFALLDNKELTGEQGVISWRISVMSYDI